MVYTSFNWLTHGNFHGEKLISNIADKMEGIVRSKVIKTKDSLMNLYKKSWKNVKQEPEPTQEEIDAKPKSKYA